MIDSRTLPLGSRPSPLSPLLAGLGAGLSPLPPAGLLPPPPAGLFSVYTVSESRTLLSLQPVESAGGRLSAQTGAAGRAGRNRFARRR